MTGWGLEEGWWTEPAMVTWLSQGQWCLALPAALGVGVRWKREWSTRAGVMEQFEPATVFGLVFGWLFLCRLKSKWQGRWWLFLLLALRLKLSRGYKMNQYLRCSWLPTVGLSHGFLHTLWQPVQGSGRGDGCSGLHLGSSSSHSAVLPGAMATSQSQHPVCQSWTGVSWKRISGTSLEHLS